MKNAIVTGASFGIGKAISIALAKDGINVIAVARNAEELKSLSENYDNIKAYQLDITDEDAVADFIESINDIEIHILVNNASGGGTNKKVIEDLINNWRLAYEINVVAPVNLSKMLIPNMIKNNDGHVVFITSTCGHYVYSSGSGYAIAKQAEVALTELLRMELIGTGVRVTEIAPGNVNSRQAEGVYGSLNAEDIAEAVRWSVTLPSHVNVESIKILHINNPIR
jgi:NADP-dependent 3-hydroxy acid dehydrogenase YdfG